jgi:hypothetical protein
MVIYISIFVVGAMMKYRTFSTYILLKYGGQTSGEHLDTFPWSLYSRVSA